MGECSGFSVRYELSPSKEAITTVFERVQGAVTSIWNNWTGPQWKGWRGANFGLPNIVADILSYLQEHAQHGRRAEQLLGTAFACCPFDVRGTDIAVEGELSDSSFGVGIATNNAVYATTVSELIDNPSDEPHRSSSDHSYGPASEFRSRGRSYARALDDALLVWPYMRDAYTLILSEMCREMPVERVEIDDVMIANGLLPRVDVAIRDRVFVRTWNDAAMRDSFSRYGCERPEGESQR
jgi:hypothetical protein